MNILSTNEAAERLGISPARVRDLIVKGRLPARKVGRDFLIFEEDLANVWTRKLGKPGKDVVNKMIQSYWETKGRGELILDFKAVERDRARTRARHDVSAIIIQGGKRRVVKTAAGVSIAGKEVRVVEASPYRFGTPFLGTLLLTSALLARHNPRPPVKVTGLVGEEDQDLSYVLELLAPKALSKNISVELGEISYGSPYAKMNAFERDRVEAYWRGVKGIFLEKQALAAFSKSKGHPVHGVILQSNKFTKICNLETLQDYPGKIRVVHATPRRLNIPIIGRAIGAYYLLRLAYKVEAAESVILCKSDDSELSRILKQYFPFVTVETETPD